MASLKIWSGLKIPQKLSTKLLKVGSLIRQKSTLENAVERFPPATQMEPKEVGVKLTVKQLDLTTDKTETILPTCRTLPFEELVQAQCTQQQTHNETYSSLESDSDLDFLHQIGKNRFPKLENDKWWGLYEGIKLSELSQFSQLKMLLAMLCVWSMEQAQTFCAAANKIYQQNVASDESADVYWQVAKPEFQTSARSNMIELVRTQEKQAAPFKVKPEEPRPAINVFDEKALRARFCNNSALTYQPPYPRLQPNISKFAEGLLNGPIHFIPVKRAFSTSQVTCQNASDAEVVAPNDQTGPADDRSPTRMQFLQSCSGEKGNVLNRESYTRETINKMTNVIKRLPSIADIKKAEQIQKKVDEARPEVKFEKNVYFLGNKGLNNALRENSESVLSSVVQGLKQDVNKLSQDKAVLCTEVKDLNDQVEALAQRETGLKKEIAELNKQFHAISSENREMFKVKEATSNLVEELCLRRDVLAKEEEVLWNKLERLNKRIAEKYKRVNPYGEYNDDLFAMESMLCSENDFGDERKAKAGQFLHKKICPVMQASEETTEQVPNDPESVKEDSESDKNRAQVKAMIMEANKHRFRRCEIPINKDKLGNARRLTRRKKATRKA